MSQLELNRKTLSLIVAGAAALMMAEGAVAQKAGLEEMVVTAQKREQDIQDVPISMTAIGGEALRCLLYTSPSPRDRTRSRMPSSA